MTGCGNKALCFSITSQLLFPQFLPIMQTLLPLARNQHCAIAKPVFFCCYKICSKLSGSLGSSSIPDIPFEGSEIGIIVNYLHSAAQAELMIPNCISFKQAITNTKWSPLYCSVCCCCLSATYYHCHH